MPNKQKRILFLLIYFLLACFFVWLIKPDYFFSILIVLLPPSLINFFWLKKSKRKVLIFSLLATLIFAPPVELIARLADAWDVQSIFPRPFGLIPLENMLFAFLNIFWAICFYEYFVDRDTTKTISKKLKILTALYCFFALLVFSFYFLDRNFLKMNYAFLSVPILIIPCLLIFSKKPVLLKKTILPTLFFGFLFFVYEIVSLKIGSWWWPGEYLYAFTIFGKAFPLDDIIIWYLLSTPTLIGGYEFFTDDWQ